MLENDDEQSLWKNSEVMRIFADLYFEEKSEDTSKVDPEVPPTLEQVIAESEDAIGIERKILIASVERAIEKIASLSSEYGNEKVRYMLDRARAELEEIVQIGETDVF